MARLFVKGRLADDTTLARFEVSPQELIDKFIGADTGAPLKEAVLTLETDDGHAVTLTVAVPRTWHGSPANEMRAVVDSL
ncbi:MAG TPA: hypothetical protein VHT92_11240 [Candidatus Cybelea sp.]|nr:hypothetical protein [Candidatus Cybelea sp.]